MKTWVIGWEIKKYNLAIAVFCLGQIFRMEFGDNGWIAGLVTALLMGFTLRRE
ncbi:TPA: hypothetical protein R2K43_000767 [Raoultella planticola]|uniref:hypothetical protein n=1 Tax=Raoultella planticola TaxID=575 RepID=UPI0015C68E01|nr:hypothetical protein [Raoultella planticola]HEC2625610.1 hypothetical protein [Raoultella planticola]